MKTAFSRAGVMKTAINGFHKTGIYPFNRWWGIKIIMAIPDDLYTSSEAMGHAYVQRCPQAAGTFSTSSSLIVVVDSTPSILSHWMMSANH